MLLCSAQRSCAVVCCAVQVFMVSDQALLDEGLVRAMLHSGHSRVPVYR
jgi:CBS domain containing-hemolysin-like protein